MASSPDESEVGVEQPLLCGDVDDELLDEILVCQRTVVDRLRVGWEGIPDFAGSIWVSFEGSYCTSCVAEKKWIRLITTLFIFVNIMNF